MGNFSSKLPKSSNIYSEVKMLMASKKQFLFLGLSENDVSEIFEVFSKIDVDGSLEITIEELLIFINTEQTKFVMSIFNCFDRNHNHKIDLKEFIFACWNYCTLNHERLCAFIFELYDKDESGILDKMELGTMLRDAYGSNYDNNANVTKLVNKHNREGHDMTLEYFTSLIKTNSAILYPACLLQTKLRTTVCGMRFWLRIEKQREAIYGLQYVPIDLIFSTEGNREVIDEILKEKHEKQERIRIQRKAEKKAPPMEPVSEQQLIQQRRVSVLQKLYWVTNTNTTPKKDKSIKKSSSLPHEPSEIKNEERTSTKSLKYSTSSPNNSTKNSKKYKVSPVNTDYD